MPRSQDRAPLEVEVRDVNLIRSSFCLCLLPLEHEVVDCALHQSVIPLLDFLLESGHHISEFVSRPRPRVGLSLSCSVTLLVINSFPLGRPVLSGACSVDYLHSVFQLI